MLRTLSTTAGAKPEASLCSMKRLSPRWTTFRIFISKITSRSVTCQATLYSFQLHFTVKKARVIYNTKSDKGDPIF